MEGSPINSQVSLIVPGLRLEYISEQLLVSGIAGVQAEGLLHRIMLRDRLLIRQYSDFTVRFFPPTLHIDPFKLVQDWQTVSLKFSE